MRHKSEKELFIINNYKTMPRKEMSNELNVSLLQIDYYLRKNNIRIGKFCFTEEENQYMREHYLYMSYKDIADNLGYTERQIRGRINNMGLRKNREINDHYFDNIDSPLKAYFLGFIYADGWIVYNSDVRNYEFGMQLQSCDKYILEKINNELGGKNIISHNDPYVHRIKEYIAHSGDSDTLRVYSKNLVLGLMKHGIKTNKTDKEDFPIVDDKYFFDFLRGYIDGDGCYWKLNNHCYMHITSSNEKGLIYLQNRLLEHNIVTHVYCENSRKYRLICTCVEDMQKLINYMYYDDCFCLSRKYSKIKSYLYGSAA